MYTKQGTSRLPCPSIGLFLEPDETGREKPSERFSRQAAAGGCARGRWNAPLARRVRHLSTQHSASPKATPPRLEFLKQEEKVADRPLHPSPRLELFSRFVRCFQRATSQFAIRSRASPPHEKIDEEDHQSSTRGLCILCVRRTLCTERYVSFLAHLCKDDAFADFGVAHHFAQMRTCYREVLQTAFVFGRSCCRCPPTIPQKSVQASATRHCAGPVRLLEQWTVRRRDALSRRGVELHPAAAAA